jgi:dTDP-4-dehydrorhamnose reductase
MPAKSSQAIRKVLLIGTNGQVGHDLLKPLSSHFEVETADRSQVDLSRAEDIRKRVRESSAGIIVNAAAYTAVDKAESDVEMANAINAVAPGVLAEEAKRVGALLIHYSTDYVFDGSKQSPYIEADPVNPINVYGRTKADGEMAIRRTGCNHFIFRTSWVFSDRGSNFLLTMLRLARERDELRIVDDQIGAPTSSRTIARATVQTLLNAIERNPASQWNDSGTYHMTSAGHVSWFGFANEIFAKSLALLDGRRPKLTPINTRDYPTPARRPLNSVLSCKSLETTFGVSMADWQTGLTEVLGSLQQANTRPNAVIL